MPVNLPTPRPRPGLHRPQLPHPGARRDGRPTARARTTPTSATSPPPAPSTSATSTASPQRRRAARGRQLRLPPRRWSPTPRGRPGTCSTARAKHADGPGSSPDDRRAQRRRSATPRGRRERGLSLTAMAYHAKWNVHRPDPQRAVDGGLISRFGTLDPTDGGETQPLRRSPPNGTARRPWPPAASGYASLRAQPVLELHLLPRRPGERRPVRAARRRARVRRLNARQSGSYAFGPTRETHARRAGPQRLHRQGRALHARRSGRSTVRDDSVDETSSALLCREPRRAGPEGSARPSGARRRLLHFDVDSDAPVNWRRRRDCARQSEAALVFGPWANTELYPQRRLGFHSNDARGATIRVDPSTGEPGGPRRPAGARQGRRGRRAHRSPRPADLARLCGRSTRLRAGVHRRRRDDRGEPAEPPLRRRVAELLGPLPWLTLDVDSACSRVPASATTTRRATTSPAPSRRRSPAASPCRSERLLRQPARALLRPAAADRGRQRPIAALDPRQRAARLSNSATAERCGRRASTCSTRSRATSTTSTPRACAASRRRFNDIHFHPQEPRTVRLSVTARF